MLVHKNLTSGWDFFNANFAKLSQIINAAVIHNASKHSVLLDRKYCSVLVLLYHMTQDLVTCTVFSALALSWLAA